MILYGPVPSRRLGQSIGINHIPAKTCSYSCTYCQLGRTNKMQADRQAFYQPEEILKMAEIKMNQLKAQNKHADYFSFVPDGEPTLDINLGKTITLLKKFKTKIAVITNASLLWRDDVKEDLMKADWVSISCDSAEENIWRTIDRPHGKLNFYDVQNGMIEFAKAFTGTLVTETMLVQGINDHASCIEKTAKQIALIRPDTAYLLVPTRPPAETGVNRPSPESLKNAASIIRSISGADVMCITGDEKEEGFFFTENIADDLLSIASVHPIREDIVALLLKKRGADDFVITSLVDQGKMLEYWYEGKKFYRKNIQNT